MIIVDFNLPQNNRLWFCSCRLYLSGPDALDAFTMLSDHDRSGRLNIGVYRHQRIGLDDEPVLVSVVGLDREKVAEAEKVLGGTEVELHPDTWVQLIQRRATAVLGLEAQGLTAGHYRVIRDGESVGPHA